MYIDRYIDRYIDVGTKCRYESEGRDATTLGRMQSLLRTSRRPKGGGGAGEGATCFQGATRGGVLTLRFLFFYYRFSRPGLYLKDTTSRNPVAFSRKKADACTDPTRFVELETA